MKITGKNRQGGLAIVEFTIVLPLVLFIMLVVAEMGKAIMDYNTLTRTVRDAARFVSNEALAGSRSVVDLSADPTVIIRAQNLGAYGQITAGTPMLPGLTPAMFTVADEGGNDISVTAAYPYQPIFLPIIPDVLNNGGNGGVFTMRAEVVMKAI